MTPSYVLDTSVVVKWFRQEEVLAARALELRAAFLLGEVQISAPTLLAYELINVLRFKPELTTGQLEDAAQSLYDLKLAWVTPDAALMRAAAALARANDCTVYDAVFAACAERLEAIFVTADRKLAVCLEHLPYVRYLGDL